MGQITSVLRMWGSPARHGFLATPSAGANVAPNIPCLGTTGPAVDHRVDFKSFDFPGAINTQATAITPSGLIVGRYNSPDGIQHGFTLRNGWYLSVDGPGANFMDVDWVNARGDLVGSFNDSRGGQENLFPGWRFGLNYRRVYAGLRAFVVGALCLVLAVPAFPQNYGK